MIKTIKTTKQMRLDELIKYIFENNIKNKYFYSEQKKTLEVDMYGRIIPRAHFNKNSVFPVEVEEEITKKTEFLGVQEVYLDIEEQKIRVENYYGKWSVEDVLNNHDGNTKCLQIYAYIGEWKELIWERENQ